MPQTDQLSLPVLPLTNGVVFPHMVVTLRMETSEGKIALEAARNSDGRLLLVPRVDGRYASVGTVAEISDTDEDGNVVVSGISRARVGSGSTDEGGALWCHAEPVAEADVINDPTLDELVNEYRAVVSEVLELRGVGGLAERFLSIDNPSQLADLAVYSPDLSLEQKVEVLETIDLHARVGKVLGWMREVLADLNLRKKVREEAAEKIDKSQREYILRQQMDAIRKELGDDDDVAGQYRQKLEEADLPEKVAEAVGREIDRLERMSEQSPEHSWIRTWLDTMFEVPWSERTEDRLDLNEAWAVLDADHTGLHDVKERIVEHLAVRKLRKERGLEGDDRRAGAILLLVGPPGVGKTSLGESVARALGRNFVRVALGGVRDEAEIRGHRRTYVGARPGRIVRALTEAGSMNPVFLLDEMDKVGNDWRGDPSSALLEVLDPAQNHTFRDHYLETDLDLSDVLFIATANVVETIPAPLLDRTEVISIDGYTDNEKVEIARDHLLPRQLRAAGLEPEELSVTESALATVVDRYTREAGVRNLERQLGKLARKVATVVAKGEDKTTPVVVDADEVNEYLGKPKVWKDEAKDRTDVPGVATGLAVTGAGGDVLFVEATFMEGNRDLVLTGQLGDVMKESARIALSFVESHAGTLGIDSQQLDRRFHVHVPAGAIPKDGPSAGITMTTALASLLSGRKVRPEVGMTGEVTLQGKVLPIGGVKQKVLAAHRAGLTEIILPVRNEVDLDDVPEAVRDEMKFHLAEDMTQVLDMALESQKSEV
ncbi:MAG TPA: endopeptidase La [Acidimicrobiia bacterium]|nr:endopeptidase La [Acidimicrobiia bacterium]